jgi:hypothetical protein
MQLDPNSMVRLAGPIDGRLARCSDPDGGLRKQGRRPVPRWAAPIMLAGLSAILAACSTNSSDLVHLPDGQSGFAINCSGAGSGSNWGECYQKAGDACGAGGYDIVSKDNDDGAAAGGGVSNLATANVKSRSMIVRCK